MIPTQAQELATRAISGDAAALEQLLSELHPLVYRLAVRMLWHPEDARDATQEILIRILTGLSTFRSESAFSTWTYRIATNHLLNIRKSRMEEQNYTFQRFGHELAENLSERPPQENALLLEEIKLGCTFGMLQCLDRPARLAYILGEILEFNHEEAAAVLEITPAAYRQRISRARSRVVEFMRAHCGLVDAANPCHCSRRVEFALRAGRVHPDRLLFARTPSGNLAFEVEKLDAARSAAALYRSASDAIPPMLFTQQIRDLLSGFA
ncbi:MAG TPA: RNA polymerase sigma factor [Bryobacteraceae bacterium]|nr:RNA polymerase sigma factor [Bryobacteraceae bacterium]